MKNRKPVDIIVPIYNDFVDLVLCLRSVRKYTDLKQDRIILIDDCSTDIKILPFLETQVEENVMLLHNESNKGFSDNVNKGMMMSDERDVILLNSDTIVTKNWVDKIVRCAYSSTEIGTVTPLANSGTLCSVPVICQDNEVPDKVTIDEYAEIIERCSFLNYPRIPVAVGFCMFIKREVINAIGMFDAKTFEKGYGGVNDFCNRAEQIGYIHVMCDDTFIYHKGTGSFSKEEKLILEENHEAILQKRYPKQMKLTNQYCIDNPEQYIRDNISQYVYLKNGKKNILYLVQSDFRKDADNNVGGTQLHVKDMVEGFRDIYNIFVMARVVNTLRLTIYCDNRMETYEFFIGPAQGTPLFFSKKQRSIYDTVLSAFSIDLVHIHHIHNLTFDLFYSAKAHNIPIHLTLHDYYFICANNTLLMNNEVFCNCCNEEQICKECLEKSRYISPTVNFKQRWYEECRSALNICDLIYTPSDSAKKWYEKVYPEVTGKIQVIPHGNEELKEETLVLPKILKVSTVHSHWDHVFDNDAGKNALIGWAILEGKEATNLRTWIEVIDRSKNVYYIPTTMIRRDDLVPALGYMEQYRFAGFSAYIIPELYEEGPLSFRIVLQEGDVCYTDDNIVVYNNTKKNISKAAMNIAFVGSMVPSKGSCLAGQMIKNSSLDVNWFIFGGIYDNYLKNLEQNNLIKIGTYQKQQLPNLFEKFHIDLVCILSICPETFCYTLTETWMCGIPVIATDIGALGERIRKSSYGWLVPVDASYDTILQKIQSLIGTEEYREVKTNVQQYRGKSIPEMVSEYKPFYEESFCTLKKYPYDVKMIFDAHKKIV